MEIAINNSRRRRIAVLVPNPCDPDYRVIKQAEFFAGLGHDVRIFCQHKDGLAIEETINGVTYIRRDLRSSKNAIYILFAHLMNRIRLITLLVKNK